MKSSRENWGELLKLVTRRNVWISGAAVCGDSNCFCMHRLLVFNLIYIPASDAAQSSSGFLPTLAALWSSSQRFWKKLLRHPSNANRHRPLIGGFVYVWPGLYRLAGVCIAHIWLTKPSFNTSSNGQVLQQSGLTCRATQDNLHICSLSNRDISNDKMRRGTARTKVLSKIKECTCRYD